MKFVCIFMLILLNLSANEAFNEDAIYKNKIKCSNNDVKACSSLEQLYFFTKQTKQALEYGIKACNLGDSIACNNVGVSYQEDGIFKNEKRAMEYYKKACILNNSASCYTVGKILEYEYKQLKKILEYYEKACELNHSGGCLDLGFIFSLGKFNQIVDKKKALLFYEKASSLGDAIAKRNLAIFYATGQAGLKVNREKAIALFKEASNLGDVEATFLLGYTFYIVPPFIDKKKSAYWIKKAMDMGHQKAEEMWNKEKLWNYE